MKNFRQSSLALLFGLFILFVSCEQYDLETATNPSARTIESVNSYSTAKSGDFTDTYYFEMMKTMQDRVDKILLDVKPSRLSLQDYKVELIDGKESLSEKAQEEIMIAAAPLIEYGRFMALENQIDIDPDDPSETMALGYFLSPSADPGVTYPGNYTGSVYQTNGITPGEIAICAAVAIGADLIWSLGASSASTWTVAAITKAFSGVAKRFLGPIGVAIAVVSFGVCLAEMSD